MRRLPPLSALRAFEAAARLGGVKPAAAELGVTPSAISHRVRALEAWVGAALLRRTARGVQPTREGSLLYPALRDGFDRFAEGLSSLSRRDHRQQITVSATAAFAAKWLVPRAASFRERNPGHDLRIHASDEVADIASGACDVAIRYGRGSYAGLTSDPLIADRFAPVCNPTLNLRRVADLRRHNLIHFDWRIVDAETPTWRRWVEVAQRKDLDPDRGLTFSDEGHAIQAAVAGQGVALLSLVLVASELESGTLIQPFGPELPGRTYFLVHAPGRTGARNAMLIGDWVRDKLRMAPPTSRRRVYPGITRK